VELGDLIAPARVRRAGSEVLPILSMTMHDGLVDQSAKFKKRIASDDVSSYKVIVKGQLVVGFPIDEGVLDFQSMYERAIVSPAYGAWDLVDDRLVERRYLQRYLRSAGSLAYYRAKLRGSTARRRSLPTEVFLALPVPLPPLDEQRRIAAILDQADALQAMRRKSLTHLELLTQSIFLEMFGAAGQPSNRPLPLAEVVREGTIVTYGIVQAGAEYPGGVPYIRTGDLTGGRIELSQLRCTDPEIAARFARSRVERGDIVMSIRATVGTTALVPELISGANLTQGTARIAPGPEVLPEYLLHYLRSPAVQGWIQRQVKGATFREITLARLRELEVDRPPMDLQAEFVMRIREVRAMQSHGESVACLLTDLKQSLQERAFAGTI
jgi:type I restriction enzyme S subunit